MDSKHARGAERGDYNCWSSVLLVSSTMACRKMGGFGERLEIENVILKNVLQISLCLHYYLCNKKKEYKIGWCILC